MLGYESVPPVLHAVACRWRKCVVSSLWRNLDLIFGRGRDFPLYGITTTRPAEPPKKGYRKLSSGVNRLGCEDDQLPSCSNEMKNAWRYTSLPSIRLHFVFS